MSESFVPNPQCQVYESWSLRYSFVLGVIATCTKFWPVKWWASIRKFYGRHMTWLTVREYVTNDQVYVQFVVMTIRPFPHSWLLQVCKKSNTCGAGLADPSRAPKLTPFFSGVQFTRISVFCVVFCRSFIVSFWPLECMSFNLRLLITPLGSLNFSNFSCDEQDIAGFFWLNLVLNVWLS